MNKLKIFLVCIIIFVSGEVVGDALGQMFPEPNTHSVNIRHLFEGAIFFVLGIWIMFIIKNPQK